MNVLSQADDSVGSKCINCGAAIMPSAKFCPNCGAAQTSQPVNTAAPSMPSEEPSPKPEATALTSDDEGLQLSPLAENVAAEAMPKSGRIPLPLVILGALIVVAIVIVIVRADGRSSQGALPSATPAAEYSTNDATTDTRLQETLQNRTYVFHHGNSVEQVKLVNGKAEIDGESYDLGIVVLGDLNGDGKADAVAVLGESGGGSGYFEGLVAAVSNNGSITNSEMFPLGDRVHINSLEVKNQVVTVDMITQGPNDPMCCPSLHKVLKLTLAGNQLVEANKPTDRTVDSPAHSPKYAFRIFRTGQPQAETSRYLKLLGYSPLTCEPFDKYTNSTECTASAKFVPQKIRVGFNRFGLTGLSFDFPSSQFNQFFNEVVATNGQPTKPLHSAIEPIHHTTFQVVEWSDREQCPCEAMQIIQNANGTDSFFLINGPLSVSGFAH